MRIYSAKRLVYIWNSLAVAMLLGVVVLYVIWTTGDIIEAAVPHHIVTENSFVCRDTHDDARPARLQTTFQSSTFGFSSTTTSTAATSTPTTPGTTSNQLPTIYFVTPTYPRREQIPELTRLGQTLMHVPNLHWIVADDFDGCNSVVDALLMRFGIPFTHISSPMPDLYRTFSPIPRGVANRRAAIHWIRANGHRSGVMYFGDDDNTFDLKLFSEIRDTQKVSMFPVGLVGMYSVSAPIVEKGKIIGFFDSWPAKRQWPVDMAGFAVNLAYLARSPNATMPYKAGYEEDEFLQSIGLQMDDIEPKANECTEVLVWHTQTKKEKPAIMHMEPEFLAASRTSLGPLINQLHAMGVSHVSGKGGIIPQISKHGKSKPITSSSFL